MTIKKAIVTGSCGFLGQNLIKSLIENNIFVYGFDLVNDSPIKHELYMYQKCDIEKNEFSLIEDLRNSDVIFHFAWNGVHSDYRDDYYRQEKNIPSLLNTLSFAKKNNIKRIIIPGSSSEYAESEMPINGNNKFTPIDAYGTIKACCHLIAQEWSIKNNIPLILVIPSSIYGPGRDDNNILTYTIKTLLKNEKPSFTPLEQKWDYLYIDDYIRALLLIAENGVSGKCYPCGFGVAKELSEYIKIIKNAINPFLELVIGDRPYKGTKPDNSIIDNSELEKDTGFKPRVSFEDGIKRTIDWIKNT